MPINQPNEDKTGSTANQDFPTFEQKIEEIRNALISNSKLAMVLIDTTPIKNIEAKYSKRIFEHILESIKADILGMKNSILLHPEDIIVTNYASSEYFYVFLVHATRGNKVDITTYEKIAEEFQLKINNSLFTVVAPLLKESLKVNVGYAVTFHNPSIKEERLLHDLILDAQKMAAHQELVQNMVYKEKVYNLISDKKVKTFYQPIVNLQTHDVLGYEASSKGPEKTEFENSYLLFYVAKEIGLLYELDWLCKINIFMDAKNLAPGLKLFVNVLSTAIYDSDVRIKYLEEILDDTSINPKDVVFEVTEKNMILDFEFFNKIRKLYSKTSFAVVIDETWIGSHLSAIKDLKVPYIKLDMNLVRDIDRNRLNQELVKTTVEVAAAMKAQVIAEGIQTKMELHKLLDLGVKCGQGFLFARPGLPFPEINITEMYVQDDKLKKNLLASIYFKRGMDYYNKQDYDKSILEFSKVLEVDTRNVEALYHRALSYIEDGSIPAAIMDLQRLAEIDAQFVPGYYTLGLVYEKVANTESAITAYEKYVKYARDGQDELISKVKQRLSELTE